MSAVVAVYIRGCFESHWSRVVVFIHACHLLSTQPEFAPSTCDYRPCRAVSVSSLRCSVAGCAYVEARELGIFSSRHHAKLKK